MDRITCPIGRPEIAGKEPAVIAVSVAADLLPAAAACRRAVSSPLAVTLYRAAVLDVPGDPFAAGADALRAESDAAILVRDGTIVARGAYADWPRSTATRRRSTSATGCCCPAWSTPTCTTRRSG